MNHTCILHLGANTGNPLRQLLLAKDYLEEEFGPLFKESSYYKTEAWGKKNQAEFINQVVIYKTNKSCFDVLDITQSIESKIGRNKNGHWASRDIDIDILFFDQEIIDTSKLSIPHKQIHLRNFVLIPLAEIAENYLHPIFNKDIRKLIIESTDDSNVVLL